MYLIFLFSFLFFFFFFFFSWLLLDSFVLIFSFLFRSGALCRTFFLLFINCCLSLELRLLFFFFPLFSFFFFFYLSIFCVSSLLFRFCFFFFFSDSFQLFIYNFLDVLNSSFCFQFSLGFPSFYRPLSWSSRFKLRFEIMPCGHELAFSTKSYYVVYYAKHMQTTQYISERTQIHRRLLYSGTNVLLITWLRFFDTRRETILKSLSYHTMLTTPRSELNFSTL